MTKKINVLSLFDGISCGQVALERAGISVNNYYACEIDKYAIQVTQKNYPNTIQLGDVTKWQEWDIDWTSIDLLIGGSPCQGFSFAGKQLNFNDERSKLFFVYVDILNHIKKFNPNVKFLLENVKMKKEYENIISECLGVQPILINSNLLSAQNRNRLYWANWYFGQPTDKNIFWNDIMLHNAKNVYYVTEKMKQWIFKSEKRLKKFKVYRADSKEKMQMIEASHYKGISNQRCFVILDEHNGYFEWRYIHPVECERCQTLPDNYTDIISNTQRYKALGNGWTVDVIAHIFKQFKKIKIVCPLYFYDDTNLDQCSWRTGSQSCVPGQYSQVKECIEQHKILESF